MSLNVPINLVVVMNEIIGRVKEKIELKSVYKSMNAEFIAMYGRRCWSTENPLATRV